MAPLVHNWIFYIVLLQGSVRQLMKTSSTLFHLLIGDTCMAVIMPTELVTANQMVRLATGAKADSSFRAYD